MLEKDWLRFLFRFFGTVIKYMLLGALALGIIGVLIAAAAALYGDRGPLTAAYVAPIAGRYMLIGLLGGGIIGMLYGLLGQGSYSE